MIYFLGAILALLPAYIIRFRIGGIPTTFLEILIVVFLLLVVARVVNNRFIDLKKIKDLGPINYAIAGFILAAVISTIISPEKLRALGQLKAFILEPVLLFYASVLIIKTKEQLNIILKLLLAGGVLVSLFGILQYFTNIYLPLKFWGTGEEIKRISAFFEHPNALALYLAPLAVFYFTLAIKKYDIGIGKLLLWSLIPMFIALTLTFSRGAWAAVIIIIIWFLIRHFGYKKMIPAIALFLVVLLLIPSVRQRIALGFNDPSSEVHVKLWRLGIETISQNPILGTGLHSFQAFTVENPHNIFLNFWVAMGLLGLVSFVGIIIFAFNRHKQKPSILALASVTFLLVVIIHGMVDMPYFKNDLSVLFWFMVSLFFTDQK